MFRRKNVFLSYCYFSKNPSQILICLCIHVYQQTLSISRVNIQNRQLLDFSRNNNITEISHIVLMFLQRLAKNEDIIYTKPKHTPMYSLSIKTRKRLIKRGGILNGVPLVIFLRGACFLFTYLLFLFFVYYYS